MFWIHDLWLQKRFLSTNREQNCLKSNKTDTILALGFYVFLNNAQLTKTHAFPPMKGGAFEFGGILEQMGFSHNIF